MDAKKVEEIKNLIKKAELESAKAQGEIEAIKRSWKESFGTDDVEEIKKIMQNMRNEISDLEAKGEKLYNKLLESYDWDNLEREINGN